GLTDVRPRQVVLGDVGPVALGTRVSLDIQLDDPASQFSNPAGGIAKLPMVANVELHSDPRRVELVNVLDELGRRLLGPTLGIIQELVPNVFDGDRHPQLAADGERLT